jgi:hypothetical protein
MLKKHTLSRYSASAQLARTRLDLQQCATVAHRCSHERHVGGEWSWQQQDQNVSGVPVWWAVAVATYSWPANGLYCASPRAGLGTAEQFLNGLCLGNDRMGTGIARSQDPYRPSMDVSIFSHP